MREITEKELKICDYLAEFQIKNIKLNKDIEHKQIVIDTFGSSVSITPLTFNYDEKTTKIKDDFIFYLKRENLLKIKTDIKRFRNSEFYIVEYKLDDDVYELVFCPPVTVILC